MTTVRLPEEMENKLYVIAHARHQSKSEIIKEALALYMDQVTTETDSYDLGEDLFGRHGSGQSDRSVNYKTRLKQKIHDKNHPR